MHAAVLIFAALHAAGSASPRPALSRAASQIAMTRIPSERERGKFVVLGGGSFGCAMALLLSRKGHRVDLLVRKRQVCDHINEQRRNPTYLSEFELPALVRATTDPAEAFRDAQYMCHAVPVQFSRAALTEVQPHMAPGMPILSLSKGIEQGSLSLMCDLLGSVLGEEHPMAFLSGPAFAREIAAELATAVVIASDTPGLASEFGSMLSSDVFRCYYTQDVIGVEVGGAVKNVIAIAAGMCEGLGLGTNAMAALVTRGCSEVRAAFAAGARRLPRPRSCLRPQALRSLTPLSPSPSPAPAACRPPGCRGRRCGGSRSRWAALR